MQFNDKTLMIQHDNKIIRKLVVTSIVGLKLQAF